MWQGVLHIPQISKAGASPLDGLISYYQDTHGGGLPLCRNAVSVFYNPSWQGFQEDM